MDVVGVDDLGGGRARLTLDRNPEPGARMDGVLTADTYTRFYQSLPDEPPSSWTCFEGFYGVDDGCDCECGAVDPDCYDASDPLNTDNILVYGCYHTGDWDASCSVFGTCTSMVNMSAYLDAPPTPPDDWACSGTRGWAVDVDGLAGAV